MGRLYLAIGDFLAGHPGVGRVFLSLVDLVFTIHDVVEPDLVFVAGDQTDILTEANIQGAPAIVVEILSKSTRGRDERIKKELFDRGGVREYWIVDPDRGRLTAYQREEGKLDARKVLTVADRAVLTTPLMAGFSLSIAELFRPT